MAAASACYGMSCSCVVARRNGGLRQLLGASNYVLPLKIRDTKFRVRSQLAENDETKDEQAAVEFEAPPKPITPLKPKVSSNFFDVLAFSGPAPERINGRLAMTGFVAAMAVEVASGRDIFSQIQNGGLSWFLFTSALLSVASLVPLFSGSTPESKAGAIMTSNAELWNGRFAMLGLVALALTEFLKGGALVSL